MQQELALQVHFVIPFSQTKLFDKPLIVYHIYFYSSKVNANNNN